VACDANRSSSISSSAIKPCLQAWVAARVRCPAGAVRLVHAPRERARSRCCNSVDRQMNMRPRPGQGIKSCDRDEPQASEEGGYPAKARISLLG